MLALIAAPNLRRAECIAAASRHAATVAGVAEALRAYAECVASRDRSNDCGNEIEAVDAAHESFTAALDKLRDCP